MPADTVSPSPPPPSAASLAAAIGTKRLIIAIAAMPFIFAAITAGIVLYVRAHRAPAVTETAAVAAPALAAEPLHVPAGGRIVETLSDGRHLIVRIEAPGGGEIAVYDVASGRRLWSLPVVAAPRDISL